jgi:hypothetical protein
MDILQDVISSPHYDLAEPQVQEILGWAEDYNGQMPPDVLEDILKNMSGVAKQRAQLVAKRYSIKLNNWMRKQNSSNEGPPIGALGPSPDPTQRSRGPRQPQTQRQGQSQPSPPQSTPEQPDENQTTNEEEEFNGEPD